MKMTIKNISEIEDKIGISFSNAETLENAFVHRSFLNENRSSGLESNERLEFLGDAVLELAVTKQLYNKFTDKSEGELTAIRSALVKGKTLSELSASLGFVEYLLLSEGEKNGSEKAKSLILANCMEAVIGAIYIDKGFEEAEKFVNKFLTLKYLDNIIDNKLYIDPKSEYQEIIQEKYRETPKYELIEEDGPDHDKKFVCGVRVGEELIATGAGCSKSRAEQNAAQNALEKLTK